LTILPQLYVFSALGIHSISRGNFEYNSKDTLSSCCNDATMNCPFLPTATSAARLKSNPKLEKAKFLSCGQIYLAGRIFIHANFIHIMMFFIDIHR
jgi:hypothetical protein